MKAKFPLLSMMLLFVALVSCTEKSKLEYIPVALDEDDERTTLMAPDGSVVDYDFKGNVQPVVNGYFVVEGKKGWTVYKFDKKEAREVDGLDDLYWTGFMSQGVIPVKKRESSKVEFYDGKGNFRFSLGKNVNCTGLYTDGMMVVWKYDSDKNETIHGAINSSGEQVVKMKYKFFTYFNEGHAVAKIGDKFIVIGKNGDEVCTLKGAEGISSYVINGLIAGMKGGNYGFFNLKGEFTKVKDGLRITDFNGNYAIVCDTESYEFGVVNTKGEKIVSTKYGAIQFIGSDNFACMDKDDEKWQILNLKGEVQYSINEKQLMSYNSGSSLLPGDFVVAGGDNRYYLYDSKGQAIKKSKFASLR